MPAKGGRPLVVPRLLFAPIEIRPGGKQKKGQTPYALGLDTPIQGNAPYRPYRVARQEPAGGVVQVVERTSPQTFSRWATLPIGSYA